MRPPDICRDCQAQIKKLPQTRIDSMPVYESSTNIVSHPEVSVKSGAYLTVTKHTGSASGTSTSSCLGGQGEALHR